MTEPARVFISYRREETAPQAGRLFDGLVDRLGEPNVFMDVDSIQPGTDWEQAVIDAVASCGVLLAIIGPRWISLTDAAGDRRINDEHDLVRVEIETALARDIRVVPVLINGATVPDAAALPGNLGALTRRQAVELDDRTFRADVGRLYPLLGGGPAPAAAPTLRRTATVTERSHARRTIRLALDHEHVLAINAWVDTVKLDDSLVVKKTFGLRGTHAFVIDDGGTHRNATLYLDVALTDRIRHVVLTVDGTDVYRE
jgi:hypothetical protein